MTVDGALASNEMLGIVLFALIVAFGATNRSLVRELFDDPSGAWRIQKRLAAVTFGVFGTWATFFDNWRQLTGVPFRAIQTFPSHRVEFAPPSDTVRTVTYVLLAIALPFSAAAFSRTIGGYGLQLVLGLLGFAAWLPLFVVRQRLGISLALGAGDHTVLGITGFAAFLLVAWCFDLALIVTSYLALTMAVALPVTLLLDLLRLRHPRAGREAQGYFSAIGREARVRPQTPLIRRVRGTAVRRSV